MNSGVFLRKGLGAMAADISTIHYVRRFGGNCLTKYYMSNVSILNNKPEEKNKQIKSL